MIRELSREALLSGVKALRGAGASVMGDVMLDHYQYGSVERISPEAPVPVVRVEQEEYRLGGAANVARNLATLGGNTALLGCCGNTEALSRIRELLGREGISDGLLACPGRSAIQKTRVIAQGQQVLRIDKEDNEDNPEPGRTVERAAVCLRETGGSLILSDYGKGELSDQVLSSLAERNLASHIFIDPKPERFPSYPAPDLITPNRREAERIWGGRLDTPSRIIRAGDWIQNSCGAKNLLITMGGEGMVLFDSSGVVNRISTQARHVFDVTGAGDTVIAVASLALTSGMDSLHACVLANIAAGLVVEQVGAAAVSPAELEEQIRAGETFSVHNWR